MNQKWFRNIILIGVMGVLVGIISYLNFIKKPATSIPFKQLPNQNINSGSTSTNQNSKISPQTNQIKIKTYRGNSFEFNYPSILSIVSQGDNISITHSVSYYHDDPCDFKGDASPLDKILILTFLLNCLIAD